MTIRIGIRVVALAAIAAAAASCGDVVRSSRAPVMLVVNSLQASSGSSTTLSGVLFSDVVVNVTSPAPCTADSPCPTVFADNGSASLAVVMKDATVSPTTNNQVTISRYHVAFRRADGRNTEGVDVPYAFDGAATQTIAANATGTITFEIVRHVAKEEPPLAQLVSNPAIISTIADVTFFGRDLVGNDISVTGSMLIEFGNFGDTQ